MAGKKKKKKELTPKDLLKMEIAKELGLWEKIEQKGWAELTAEESGRIGGIMTSRFRQSNKRYS
ncbi:MAG: small, acid-soluble spore protein, alpha/beta type [Peptococcia bacterium]